MTTNKTPNPSLRPCPYSHIDVYRVIELFQVTDPTLQEAVKKILLVSMRGARQMSDDVEKAIGALVRWQEMRWEDQFVATPKAGRRAGDPPVPMPQRRSSDSGDAPPPHRPPADVIVPVPQRRSSDFGPWRGEEGAGP